VTPLSGRKAASAGGLAVGVHAALEDGGGVWFGWSGEVQDGPAAPPRTVRSGKVTYVLTGLDQDELAGYYAGFANRTLWPLFHYRLDLATFDHEWWAAYRRVNQRFVEELMPLLRPDDLIWIQDYHLIPMASELRRRGVQNRIGFFLHIPFPAAQVIINMPWHRQIAADLCAYDVVGFQTAIDLQQFKDYVSRELKGEVDEGSEVRALGRRLHGIACPIGIDVDDIRRLAASTEAERARQRLRATLSHRTLIFGVDRLDYSKGIPERLRAFQLLLSEHDEHRRNVTFLQISAPSREDVPEYREIRTDVERLSGHINGRFGDADWTPLRYINRAYTRRQLSGFYRLARVGFVTPLRDGLNLVAEEYVAAQDEQDPGVLVISRFAGASSILTGALIVNPHDPYDVAGALHRALTMSLEERADRLQTLVHAVRQNDITAWRKRSLKHLAGDGLE
jgi:trehalose 6-phosphate synthase